MPAAPMVVPETISLDDDGEGLKLNAHSRASLMARLAGTGANVLSAPANPLGAALAGLAGLPGAGAMPGMPGMGMP
eukprot:5399586-Pyramimonas_sp.AAC.1